MPSRRRVLQIGGAFLAGLAATRLSHAAAPVDIRMLGNTDGSHVWYDPMGIWIEPGRTIRWTNLDPGNSHTATAYHPRNDGHPLRIPERAETWNSDYLLPEETFSVVLTVEGVYDYFCIPHEHAGMVGRIVVGNPGPEPSMNGSPTGEHAIPAEALRAFPPVEEIMRRRVVRRT